MINLSKKHKISSILFSIFSLLIILNACSNKTLDLEKTSANTDAEDVESNDIQEEQTDTTELDFKAEDIWMRPTEAGEDAQVYMSLTNRSDEQVDLHDAMIFDVSHQVSFYEGSDNNGRGYVEIPENDTVHLTPDGLYMVFEDIEQKMNIGDTFTISLHLTPYGDVDFQGFVEDR